METYAKLLAHVDDIGLLISEAERLLLETRTAEAREKANVLTRSGVVLLTGYLEGYIRDLLEEFIDCVNELEPSIARLPDALALAHIEGGVAGCRNSVGKVRELRHVAAGVKTVKLEAKSFSKTGGNPTVDTIESLFALVGVPGVIEVLTVKDFEQSTWMIESQVTATMISDIERLLFAYNGDKVQMRQGIVGVIDKKWVPKKKRRSVGYVYQIEQLLKKRNRIAHGEGREPITPLELKEFLDHVVQLAKGLAVMLDDNIAKISKADSADERDGLESK